MDGSSRFSVDHGNRTRQTFDTPTSSYRPRVSLDAISQGSSSRYGTPSPSSMQGQNDFRTRLNRLSLQNSDSASPLSRSSSMRSRPGGGVADVGLGSRSTMLDRGSLRGGLDIGSREAAQYQQDSPYRPSTSQSRYDERGGISNPRNGRDHASTDRNRSRASPASSYSYRSARQSVSGGPSPSRTPTPTAALGYEDQLSTSSRWSQSRGSDRDATSRVSEYRQPGRTNESRGDGSSAARSVSNSTVRNFEENEDDTINFRKEKNRQIKRLEEDRAYRNTSPQLDRRSELRSERSFTPVSSHSQARGDERIIRPAEDPDMPAEEKVDMWMRSGSTRNGSGDDPAAKRRGALPFEFRSDMVGLDLHQYRGREYASDAFPSQATPTRPAAGGRQQTLTGPIHRASPARSSTGMDTSPLNAQRLSTGPATLYSGLRTSTSPTESMMTGSSRVDGAARNSEYYGTPERSLPPSMISNGSVAEDSDLAESRRRRKALLQSASRRTPLKIGSQTPIRSSTLDTSRGFDGRSQYAVGQIASEPRVSSRISHIRPSTSMSHLRDIQEPRRSVEDPRSYRQSMVYLPARTGDVGVEGLPDSPLARYHQRQTNSASMSPQTDGPFVTTRSSVLNPANGLPRAPSPTRSIMSTANSARPSTRGTPSRVAMTRLQAKLRRASDEQSKAMLEACVRLLTAFGVQEREKSAGNNVDLAGLIKNVQSVASTAEEAHQRAQSTLKKVDGLLAQCLEVDPDEDQDDDGEAAIVLVNVQAGLEEVKASLHQMGSGGKELIGLLTLVFDGLQGYHIHGQNANGNHLENVEETDTPAKTEGDAPIRSPETTFSSEETLREVEDVPAYQSFGIFTNEPSTEESAIPVSSARSEKAEDLEDQQLGPESADDKQDVEQEMEDGSQGDEKEEQANEKEEQAVEEQATKVSTPGFTSGTSDQTNEGSSEITLAEEETQQIMIPAQTSTEFSPALRSDDSSTEFPTTPTVPAPATPAQGSVPRQAVRSRKSSSTASVLSLRSRPGGKPTFSPSTPTTAVSAVVAQSAGKGREGDSTGHATPSSPLAARSRELGQQEGYFAAQNRRMSSGSFPETPLAQGNSIRDDDESNEEEGQAARPRYGTASQSLREIHQAK